MSVRGVGAEGLSISAGGATGAVSSLVFSNSPTVSFGLNGSTLTASAAGGAGGAFSAGLTTLGNTSGNTGVVTGQIVFAGVNLTLSGSTNAGSMTITASAPATSSIVGTNGISVSTNGSTISVSNIGLNLSAGTTSNNLTAITFSNSNNVSFGLNGSTLTGSVATSLTNVNLSAGTTSNNLSAWVYSNSNNVSFGLNGSTITASASVATSLTNVNLSAGTTSNNLSAMVFSNSNNVSFGLNGSTVTATITVPAQTNQTLSIVATSNTAGNTSGITVDARSLTLDGFGIASVGFSTSAGGSSIVISATQSNQAVSAQGGSSSFQTLVFTNSNNVSFSNTGGSVWGSYALNVSAGGGTSNALSAITFTNSNGVTFGLSTGAGVGTMTASIATTYAGTGYTTGTTSGAAQVGTLNTAGLSQLLPYLTRYIWPPAQLIAVTAPAGANESIQYVAVPAPITGSRIDALLAMSNSSSAGAGTVTIQFSQYAIIYTRNVSTLSSLSSGSTQTTYTYASNTAGATYLTNSAIYPLSVPINFSLEPGEYFVGFNFVTSTTAASITMSMVGGNDIQTANNYVEFANTATSTNLYAGMGVYSAATTGVVTRVSLSAINQTGSALSAANIALVFRNG